MQYPTDPQYHLPFLVPKRRRLPETIPCLSMRQPWASLLFIGNPEIRAATEHLPPPSAGGGKGSLCIPAKSLETRSWKTRHRGPLLIHASKNVEDLLDLFYSEPFYEVLRGWGGFESPDDVPVGCILGLNRLDAIFRTEQIELMDGPSDRYEKAFGDFGPGRYAWHLPSPVPFAEPIPYKGALYLFDVPVEILPGSAKAALHRWNGR